MKLLIILSIIISTNLFGQNPFFFWDDTTGSSYAGELKVPQYAVSLNGTTQYLSKTTPTGLDLNGAEMIPKDSNTTFESLDTTDWTGYGTASCDTSSTRKYAGSYSLRDVTTGVGDSTTNHISLAATNFTAIESGKKYTAEYWVNAVGELGSNLVPDSNSSFTTWGLSYWTVNGGTIARNDSGWISITESGGNGSNTGINRSSALTIGQWYSVFFRAKSYNATAGKTIVSVGDAANTFYTISKPSLTPAWQTYIFQIKPTQTQLRLYFNATASSGLQIDIDSIIIKPITQPTYTIAIGDKSFTSDTISIIPGVFEKVVFNFQATAATVGQAIKIYCSQADTAYIDNFSITPAFDATYNLWAYNNNNTSTRCLFTNKNGSTTIATGSYILCLSDGKVYCNTGDGTFGTTEINTTYSATSYYMLTYSITRTDSIRLYKNGVKVASASVTGIGKITSGPINVGKFFSSTYYHLGKIGEIQIVRGYAMSQADITENYLRGLNKVNMKSSYTSGDIVGWWFKSKSFNDNSASANNLTGTSVNATDMIEVDY